MKTTSKFILMLVLLFAASYFGLGKSHLQILSPLEQQQHGLFHKIHGDRWIEDGARVVIPDLLFRGNLIKFHFSDWHPNQYSDLEFFVCENSIGTYRAKPGDIHSIYLTGECDPRVLEIKVKNPFVVGGNDQRKLGIQVKYLELTSKFGLPLLSLQKAGHLFLLLAVLGVLGLLAFSGFASWLFTLLFPIASFFLVSHNYYSNYDPLKNLYIFILLLLIGMFFARHANQIKSIQFKPSLFYIITFLIFVCAALLRFYNIDFGLPLNYHPDEVPKFNAIERMRAHGDLNPRYFLHPTLLLYGTYFFNNVLRFFIEFSGAWNETLILSGRIMSATAGSLSVLLTALIAKRLFSSSTGILSAALLAVFPLHVTCSRYVKEDALLVFFILLAVYILVRAVQEDKPYLLLLAGLTAGFSAGVKYSGIVSVMILVAAPFLKKQSWKPDPSYIKWTIRAILIIPIGFLIVTPYALLDLSTFLKDFNHERSHMTRGHSASITAWSQLWMYHTSGSLLHGMQPLAFLVSICGIGYMLFTRKVKAWYIVALFLLYYIPAEIVKAKPAPQPERYVMPCLPFLAIAAAYFMTKLKSICPCPSKKFLVLILSLILVLQPAMRSLELTKQLRPDTRDLMQEWMRENIPKGSEILVDWRPYAPQFPDNYFKLTFLDRAKILERLEPSSLLATGADYLIMSSLYYDRYFSQPNVPVAHRERIRKVFQRFKQVKTIEPKYGTYGFHNPTLNLFKLEKK